MLLNMNLQAEVSQRLSYAKESASRNVSVQSYGDLARKLLVNLIISRFFY